jgi:hypothetical protein
MESGEGMEPSTKAKAKPVTMKMKPVQSSSGFRIVPDYWV